MLKVYEHVLLALEDTIKNPLYEAAKTEAERALPVLKRCLERDGFTYADGRITATGENPTIDELSDTAIELDVQVLRQQVERIRNAIDDDPELAIGTAKELLETTCKTILADAGVTIDPKWDLPRLAKEARTVLKLLPEDVPASAKGAEIVQRILSNLAQISVGIAELRTCTAPGTGRAAGRKDCQRGTPGWRRPVPQPWRLFCFRRTRQERKRQGSCPQWRPARHRGPTPQRGPPPRALASATSI